jgi:hypothetical protein
MSVPPECLVDGDEVMLQPVSRELHPIAVGTVLTYNHDAQTRRRTTTKCRRMTSHFRLAGGRISQFIPHIKKPL